MSMKGMTRPNGSLEDHKSSRCQTWGRSTHVRSRVTEPQKEEDGRECVGKSQELDRLVLRLH